MLIKPLHESMTVRQAEIHKGMQDESLNRWKMNSYYILSSAAGTVLPSSAHASSIIDNLLRLRQII
jgi:hypothetical protein